MTNTTLPKKYSLTDALIIGASFGGAFGFLFGYVVRGVLG